LENEMLKLAMAAFSAITVALPAAAGEITKSSPKAAIAAELMAKERASWKLYAAKDAAALTAMTSADFVDVYSGGEVVDRRRWLDDMRQVQVERQELSGFHAFELSGDTILFTYEGRAWGRTKAGPIYNHAAVTSAWARRGGKWLNVFYEETALDSPKFKPERPRP
jgi:hypothetical protein